jgi:hypothetical protein
MKKGKRTEEEEYDKGRSRETKKKNTWKRKVGKKKRRRTGRKNIMKDEERGR